MAPPSSPRPESALLAVKRDIESMKTRGAGEIGKQAAVALADAAGSFPGDDLAGFRAFTVEAARLLAAARPTAVTLRNGLNAMLASLDGTTTVPDAKKKIRAAADAYATRVDAAKRAIAETALTLLKDGDVVLTHCHSTAAGGAIAHAAKARKGIRVYSTETRPFRQGFIQAPTLAKLGVDVTLIVDSAVSFAMENYGVTKVVVGADTVDAQGGLYNKIGTRQVALLAQHHQIPFYVCCEREKFSPYSLDGETVVIEERPTKEITGDADLPGVKVRNPVFDRTPAELITAFVTDRGILKPSEVGAFIRREFGTARRPI